MNGYDNENGQLKKLQFVPEVSTKTYNLAAQAYTSAKAYVPAPLAPRLLWVEDSVTTSVSPYVAKAQDKADELLHVVDSQVSKCIRRRTS